MASRILLLSSAIAACSAASVLAPRDDAPSPGMLSLPIEHRQFVRPMVVKRQEDTNVPLLNYTTLNYMVARMSPLSLLPRFQFALGVN